MTKARGDKWDTQNNQFTTFSVQRMTDHINHVQNRLPCYTNNETGLSKTEETDCFLWFYSFLIWKYIRENRTWTEMNREGEKIYSQHNLSLSIFLKIIVACGSQEGLQVFFITSLIICVVYYMGILTVNLCFSVRGIAVPALKSWWLWFQWASPQSSGAVFCLLLLWSCLFPSLTGENRAELSI